MNILMANLAMPLDSTFVDPNVNVDGVPALERAASLARLVWAIAPDQFPRHHCRDLTGVNT
jgi:hypothetical protein